VCEIEIKRVVLISHNKRLRERNSKKFRKKRVKEDFYYYVKDLKFKVKKKTEFIIFFKINFLCLTFLYREKKVSFLNFQ